MARVLVGVQGDSTRSLSASFLAVPGVYARQTLSLLLYMYRSRSRVGALLSGNVV
jgi:hypothetical protein